MTTTETHLVGGFVLTGSKSSNLHLLQWLTTLACLFGLSTTSQGQTTSRQTLHTPREKCPVARLEPAVGDQYRTHL